jgi:prepilin-type N-terminal cleavage/methylation domain-containing protein
MGASIAVKKGSSGGFTLIEVMIAMLFLSFIVQGLAMVALHAQRSGIHSRRLTSANVLAEQALEKYRNTDYDNLLTYDGRQVCFNGSLVSVGCGASTTVFTETTTVTVDTPIANTSEVDVTVSWEDGWRWEGPSTPGGFQEAKLVSYVSKY